MAIQVVTTRGHDLAVQQITFHSEAHGKRRP
jgi:hypothetical protein